MSTETKSRPILFSGPMVCAILDGSKTNTRRVVKFVNETAERRESIENIERAECGDWLFHYGPDHYVVRCPFGQRGNQLWVRESFDIESFGAGVAQIRYKANGDSRGVSDRKLPNRTGGVPSIHMPRYCSRIDLEVTGVRVERLQEITTDDIWAEGVQIPVNEKGEPLLRLTGECPPSDYLRPIKVLEGESYSIDELARAHFASLWDSINSDDDISWKSNPWVWVVQFKKEL